MKVEEFLQIFPHGGITFTRAERGKHGFRSEGWIVYFSNCYWTSDSDRLTDHVTNHSDRDNEVFHADLETALDMFCQRLIENANRKVKNAREWIEEAERERTQTETLLTRFLKR